MSDNPSTTVSFKNDILPLFTQTDIDHMQDQTPPVHLEDYQYMSDPTDNYANANAVYQQVSSKQMPPSWGGGEGPWSDDKVALFKQWMDGGYQP